MGAINGLGKSAANDAYKELADLASMPAKFKSPFW
jgi:hypothetical protein